MIALVRESKGRLLLLLLLVLVGGIGRRDAVGWAFTLVIEEAFLMVLGLGGNGATLGIGPGGASSVLVEAFDSSTGELAFEDAETKVSLDEFEPMDARRVGVGPVPTVGWSLGGIVSIVRLEAVETDTLCFCGEGAGDVFEFTAAFTLPSTAFGRTAGGCRFGLGPNLLDSGDVITVDALRNTCGGVFTRSGRGSLHGVSESPGV